jgi:hypothetical protein
VPSHEADAQCRKLHPKSVTDLLKAILDLHGFTGSSLTRRIAALESALMNADAGSCSAILNRESVSRELLSGAYLLKRAAGQINVVIHALGILFVVPHILESGERIEYLSLGAGNTGRAFDLETTHRVAEFKFIHWQGGAETIRQNALFKDYYLLAEHSTPKRKYLYVLGTEHPLRFLRSGRSLKSIMSRNNMLWAEFQNRFGDRFSTVGEYFAYRQDDVCVVDISAMLGELVPPEDPQNPDNEE